MASKKQIVEVKEKLPPLDGKKGDTPESITRITEQYMFDYIEYHGTIDDLAWFEERCNKYPKKKIKQEVEYTGIDVPKVRREFAERFFKDAEFMKKKEKDDTPISIGDKLKKLREAKEKAEKNDN